MMLSDLTIGVRQGTLEEVATLIHQKMGLAFAPRTSSYLGGDYYASVVDKSEILVHSNLDGDEVAEEEFPDCQVLIQVTGCDDPTPWETILSELKGSLIRQTQYEP